MSELWKHLGFRENPYFATPLDISEEGCDLFVGRAVELRRLITKWASEKEGATTIIAGNIGTGKTSFLNVCQYLCLTGMKDFELPFDPPLLIPSVEKVQLEQDQAETDFLVRILRAVCRSIEWACSFIQEKTPQRIGEVLAWLNSLSQATTSSVAGGFNVSLPGAPGGGLSGSRTQGATLKNPKDVPVDTLVGILRELAESTRLIRKYQGVIVAIDNIEMVPPEILLTLLNKYRDTLFSVPYVWWVLIGQKGLYDLIEADAPRVAQRIKGTETSLDGLSWDDFLLATQVRLEAFRLRSDAVAPVDESLLKLLFEASKGEIRYIFKMADQIVGEAIAEIPSAVSVPPDRATALLISSTKDSLARLGLSDRERRVLRLLCERGVVRPKEYKDFGFQNAPNFIQSTLQPLQEKGLIAKSTEGNAALYSPRAPAILAKQFSLLDDRQVSLPIK